MGIPVPFKIKHFDQIVASELNWLASVQSLITDYNIGSVNRTILEAVAMELEEFYYRMIDALEQALPESVYESFEFARAAATTASGVVTFGRSTIAGQDYLIPAGTIVSTAELITFRTLADVTLLTGQQTVQANILAVKAGASGNVKANSIVSLNSAILGIETVTNAAAVSGGADIESAESRAERFRIFVDALPRTTNGGLVGGAFTAKLVDSGTGAVLEQVRHAKVVEPYQTGQGPRGEVDVYIDNGAGSASVELVAEAQKIIDGYTDGATEVIGYRAAGVVVNVKAVTADPVNVAASVDVLPGFTVPAVHDAVQQSIANYFDSLGIHDTLDWESILVAIKTTAGVDTPGLTSPVVDITPATGHRIILGTVTIT